MYGICNSITMGDVYTAYIWYLSQKNGSYPNDLVLKYAGTPFYLYHLNALSY